MPILEPIADPEGELSQGDLLEDVLLFATKEDGEPGALTQYKYALVVSRDCSVVHKNNVIVAGAQRKVADQSPSTQDFETVKEFLEGIRDGEGLPDVFYLGSLPGKNSRFIARLDMLFTIYVPKDRRELLAWITKHRVARLSIPFIRSIPVRLFNSIARVGYDDYGWCTTSDLEWLVRVGEADIAVVEKEMAELKATLERSLAMNGPEQEQQGLQGKLTKARTERDKLLRKLAPYTEELRSRKEATSDPAAPAVAVGAGPAVLTADAPAAVSVAPDAAGAARPQQPPTGDTASAPGPHVD